MHTISLGCTITGALEDVLIFANGMPVKCVPMGNGKFVGGFRDALIEDGSVLEVQLHLIGSNGTAYEIEYKFLDDGAEEEDKISHHQLKTLYQPTTWK
jgi:hypothetical protein